MTKQEALNNYYEAILNLERAGVIGDHFGDQLSADMMEAVGEEVVDS